MNKPLNQIATKKHAKQQGFESVEDFKNHIHKIRNERGIFKIPTNSENYYKLKTIARNRHRFFENETLEKNVTKIIRFFVASKIINVGKHAQICYSNSQTRTITKYRGSYKGWSHSTYDVNYYVLNNTLTIFTEFRNKKQKINLDLSSFKYLLKTENLNDIYTTNTTKLVCLENLYGINFVFSKNRGRYVRRCTSHELFLQGNLLPERHYFLESQSTYYGNKTINSYNYNTTTTHKISANAKILNEFRKSCQMRKKYELKIERFKRHAGLIQNFYLTYEDLKGFNYCDSGLKQLSDFLGIKSVKNLKISFEQIKHTARINHEYQHYAKDILSKIKNYLANSYYSI